MIHKIANTDLIYHFLTFFQIRALILSQSYLKSTYFPRKYKRKDCAIQSPLGRMYTFPNTSLTRYTSPIEIPHIQLEISVSKARMVMPNRNIQNE